MLFEEELRFPKCVKWFSSQLIPIFDTAGNVLTVMGISRDVTEQKESQSQLDLQAHALESASNGIVITNKAGTILWVNSAFTNMTGYSFEEAVGQNPRILKSGEMDPGVYKELWDTILSGRTWAGQLINRKKDGSLYFEKQTITPVKNNKGEIGHFIAIKEDISEDKKLEEQFRQAQKMEAVGQLAGGVAHDFNNLLTIIIGQSYLLLNDLPADSPQKEAVTEIYDAANRAAHFTQQLLTLSRKQVLKAKVICVNEVIQETSQMLRRLLRENIELITILKPHEKHIKADPSQIEQAVMNLAVNARDAMPDGGKLIIETGPLQADRNTLKNYPSLPPGEYFMLKVQDTGCGMTQEVKEHLFEPFFTTKERGKGTGLGLSTVYGIVKQFRGFIFVESFPKQGTTFKLFFPVTEEQLTPGEKEKSLEELPRGTETILIAEDEEIVRGVAVQALTRQGYHILEARNGQEALEIMKKETTPRVQILVTDMVMPFMGGSELAEKILAIHPGLKIIFTSGYTDQTSLRKWMDQGYRFLQKPYSYSELLLNVREVLDEKMAA